MCSIYVTQLPRCRALCLIPRLITKPPRRRHCPWLHPRPQHRTPGRSAPLLVFTKLLKQTAVDKRVAITSQRALGTSGSVKQPPGLLTFWPRTPKSKDHGEGPVVYQTPNVPATPALQLPLCRQGAPAGQQQAPSACQALGWAPGATHSKASLCPSGI